MQKSLYFYCKSFVCARKVVTLHRSNQWVKACLRTKNDILINNHY